MGQRAQSYSPLQPYLTGLSNEGITVTWHPQSAQQTQILNTDNYLNCTDVVIGWKLEYTIIGVLSSTANDTIMGQGSVTFYNSNFPTQYYPTGKRGTTTYAVGKFFAKRFEEVVASGGETFQHARSVLLTDIPAGKDRFIMEVLTLDGDLFAYASDDVLHANPYLSPLNSTVNPTPAGTSMMNLLNFQITGSIIEAIYGQVVNGSISPQHHCSHHELYCPRHPDPEVPVDTSPPTNPPADITPPLSEPTTCTPPQSLTLSLQSAEVNLNGDIAHTVEITLHGAVAGAGFATCKVTAGVGCAIGVIEAFFIMPIRESQFQNSRQAAQLAYRAAAAAIEEWEADNCP